MGLPNINDYSYRNNECKKQMNEFCNFFLKNK